MKMNSLEFLSLTDKQLNISLVIKRSQTGLVFTRNFYNFMTKLCLPNKRYMRNAECGKINK